MRLITPVVLAILCACEQRTPPPVVAPKQPAPKPVVADAGAAPAAEAPIERPPALEDEAGLPPDVGVVDGAVDGEDLIKLLLRDPARADASLQDVPSPDSWQVGLMAQLALRRGGNAAERTVETPLPELRPAKAGEVQAGKRAWVGRDALTLKPLPKQRGAALELPMGTQVLVDAWDGGAASVSVELATQVDYGASSFEPEATLTETRKGVVDAKWLVPVEPDARTLLGEAKAKLKAGGDANADAAVVLYRRALLLERSPRAREGLLRAGWAAKRPSVVIDASLAKLLAPSGDLELAWGCRGEAGKAKWLSAGKAKPKLPADACVTDVDARPPCEYAAAKKKKQYEALKAWREASGLTESPRLRFVVDARSPRLVYLATTNVSVRDECAEFEELKLDGANAMVRRLRLPLGTAKTVVRVVVPRYHGVEYAVVAASTELKASAWLRARGSYAWTLGAHGELELSLGVGDHAFSMEKDVTAQTVVSRPEMECSCH